MIEHQRCPYFYDNCSKRYFRKSYSGKTFLLQKKRSNCRQSKKNDRRSKLRFVQKLQKSELSDLALKIQKKDQRQVLKSTRNYFFAIFGKRVLRTPRSFDSIVFGNTNRSIFSSFEDRFILVCFNCLQIDLFPFFL